MILYSRIVQPFNVLPASVFSNAPELVTSALE
jgi:hypothetical protein